MRIASNTIDELCKMAIDAGAVVVTAPNGAVWVLVAEWWFNDLNTYQRLIDVPSVLEHRDITTATRWDGQRFEFGWLDEEEGKSVGVKLCWKEIEQKGWDGRWPGDAKDAANTLQSINNDLERIRPSDGELHVEPLKFRRDRLLTQANNDVI